jgi:hypothetical protein
LLFSTTAVNFSALLRALKHPSVTEVERRVGQHPTSMIFRDSKFAGVDGVWLPLDIAEAEATTIQVPSPLASALFQEDMAGLVSLSLFEPSCSRLI